MSYLLYVWRKRMKVGYVEMLTTPLEVILQDLEMHGLQEKYGRKNEQ